MALGSHQTTVGKSQVHITPKFIIDALGPFDVDPAADPGGSVHRLIYPDVVFGAGKIVMQTLRLPIASLVERGVDPNDIRSVAFLFDRRSSGTLYVGDVQVSN